MSCLNYRNIFFILFVLCILLVPGEALSAKKFAKSLAKTKVQKKKPVAKSAPKAIPPIPNICLVLKAQVGEGPCKNGGKCKASSDPSVGFVCECPPAYRGFACQQPRDPCDKDPKSRSVCDLFPCKRDPSNWKLGFVCLCNEKPGWTRQSMENPGCVDEDECLHSPCRNGGVCQNLPGAYKCACPPGWVGRNCEHRNLQAAAWSEWGAYGRCSLTCGDTGVQTAYRQCNRAGACVGTNSRGRECRDVPRHCPSHAVFDDTIGLKMPHGAQHGIIGQQPPAYAPAPDPYGPGPMAANQLPPGPFGAPIPEQVYNSPEQVESAIVAALDKAKADVEAKAVPNNAKAPTPALKKETSTPGTPSFGPAVLDTKISQKTVKERVESSSSSRAILPELCILAMSLLVCCLVEQL